MLATHSLERSLGARSSAYFLGSRARLQQPRTLATRGIRVLTTAMASSYKYVVLGGGNAAGYAAAEFQKRGAGKGELAILSEEPVVSYERPTLSKAYLFPESPARLPGFHTTVGGGGEKHEAAWYKDNGIDFKTSTSVTKADLKGKTLSTKSGEDVSFEKLIIASGSAVMKLSDFGTKGADLGNIFYLRNVVDADAIVSAISDAKKAGNKATIVGGGYIGLECASALNKNGIDVTVVFPEDRFMARLFTEDIASFYERFYEDKGVKIIKEDTVVGFEGSNGKVKVSELKSGKKLENDIVIVGIGARPNTELFKGQLDFLEDKPGGIKVNGKLQTSNPDVYAVGDIAAFPLAKYGITTRQEHVANARASAAHAVSHILAPTETQDYDYLPFFYSRIFNLSWQLYGINEAEQAIFFGSTDLKSPKFGTYFVDGGKVVGVFLEGGSPEELAAIKKVAVERPSAPSDLAEQGLKFATSR